MINIHKKMIYLCPTRFKCIQHSFSRTMKRLDNCCGLTSTTLDVNVEKGENHSTLASIVSQQTAAKLNNGKTMENNGNTVNKIITTVTINTVISSGFGHVVIFERSARAVVARTPPEILDPSDFGANTKSMGK